MKKIHGVKTMTGYQIVGLIFLVSSIALIVGLKLFAISLADELEKIKKNKNR